MSAKTAAIGSGKSRLFRTLLICCILILSALATQISSRIVISQNWQRTNLTRMFADALQDNAIFRARSLDPEAVWLKTDDEANSQVRSYIEENLASIIRLNGDEMSKDSNLAWVVRYKGKVYEHNWKDSYDQEKGAIDYTITSADGNVSYSGAIQPNTSFSRELTILVNPSIVPTERLNSAKGSEYSYQLVLPDDFSIRYYVPSVIKPNGGSIARSAYSFDTRNIRFCMLTGAAILLVLILLWKWEGEKNLSLLRRLRALKALPAIALLATGTAVLIASLQSVCSMNADGTLSLLLQSFGMNTVQGKMGSYLACYLLWMLFFGLVSLWLLYTKSIFAGGLMRYLREETVTSGLLRQGQKELLDSLSNPHASRSIVRLFLTGFGVLVIFSSLLMLGYHFYSVPGLLLAFLVGLILMFAFIWGVSKQINASFSKVYAASEQLAKGNFSALKPEDIGFYQPLYEELINISDSYQSALKEGLASQITKTQLISNVSHDLKTPVAGIQSYSELISLSDNMDDIREYARRLSNYSVRLSDLIADLFDVAKATSGDITLDQIDLDLSELAMQVAAEWDDQFAAKNLQLVYNLQPGVILHLDPGKTVRIMENLLSNACKYSLENSRVFLDLYAEDGLYQLVLKNTSKAKMTFNPDQIVERFVRGDSSRHESGSGLGLAIVKSFVEVQQGTFEVKTDGDLFKACISFAIPPLPDVPDLPVPAPAAPVLSSENIHTEAEKDGEKGKSDSSSPSQEAPVQPPLSRALPGSESSGQAYEKQDRMMEADPILMASTASRNAWLREEKEEKKTGPDQPERRTGNRMAGNEQITDSGARTEHAALSGGKPGSADTPALPLEAFEEELSSLKQTEPGFRSSDEESEQKSEENSDPNAD